MTLLAGFLAVVWGFEYGLDVFRAAGKTDAMVNVPGVQGCRCEGVYLK